MTKQNPIMRHDAEIERDVIGALVKFPDRMADSGVSAKHFYDELHARCFKSLADRGCSPSSISAVVDDSGVVGDICERSWSDAALGQQLTYLNQLTEIRESAKVVRRLYEELAEVDAADAHSLIQMAVGDLAAASSGAGERFWDGCDAGDAFDSKTGERIDIFFKGWFLRRSEVVVIAAPPKTGKTTFATQIARHLISTSDELTLMFTMEMSPKEIFEKDIQRFAGRRIWQQDQPQAYATARQAVIDWYRAQPGKLLLDYRGSATVSEIRSRALRAQAETGRKLRCIIIDQFDKLLPEKRTGNGQADLKSIAVSLNNLAKELDVVVIPLIQINARKEKAEGEPFTKDDIYGTAALEQDGGQIWILQKEPGTSWENGVLRCVLSLEAGRSGGTDSKISVSHYGASSTVVEGF